MAICNDDTKTVLEGIEKKKKYFKNGKAKSTTGIPWFLLVVNRGVMKIISAFVESGIDINETYKGFSAIQIAIQQNHLAVVNYLLDKKASIKVFPHKGYDKAMYTIAFLLIRFMPKEVALFERFIQLGLDVNESNCLGETPLMIASTLHNVDIVTMLLKYPNTKVNLMDIIGYPALSLAIQNDVRHNLSYRDPRLCLKIVDSLLKNGALADHQSLMGYKYKYLIKSRPCKQIFFLGTPLVYAAFEGYEIVVKLLLRHGVDVNTWFGLPLFNAAVQNHTMILKDLLLAGANIDAYIPELGTALMGAALCYHYDSVQILLGQGANMYAPLPDTKEPLLQLVLKDKNM